MAKPQYSTGVSEEQHAELMESPDAREQRRMEQLGALPTYIGRLLRGRVHEAPDVIMPPQGELPHDLLVDLGRRLNSREEILRDKFTEKIPTLGNKDRYDAYAMAANRRNTRVETDPEEIKQARNAKQRQTKHPLDKLHHNTWQQLQVARLYKAGLVHVKLAVQRGFEPDERALLISASAVEDMGYALEGKPVLRTLFGGGLIPGRMKQIGQYAAQHPESLKAQDQALFLLAQREQERREKLWGDNLERYEQPDWGGNIRPEQDVLDEHDNNQLISELKV